MVFPQVTIVKNGKHFSSNSFSITIRDGRGIDLGVKCHSNVVEYFRTEGTHAVLTIEKSGNAAHFQGGLIFASPRRQDHLRNEIMALYKDMNWDASQLKHALKVKAHNDPAVLFNYCCKERRPIIYRCKSLSIEKLLGCNCSQKWEICRFCDPHKKRWYSRDSFELFWKEVSSSNSDRFLDILLKHREDLCPVYAPFFVYVKPKMKIPEVVFDWV